MARLDQYWVERLDIGGFFLATTARCLQFEDGSVFGTALAPIPPALLSVNPSALLFSQVAASRCDRGHEVR